MPDSDPVKLLEELQFLIDDEQLVAANELLSRVEALADPHGLVDKFLRRKAAQLDILRLDAAAVLRAKAEFDEDDDWTFVQVFRGVTTSFKQVSSSRKRCSSRFLTTAHGGQLNSSQVAPRPLAPNHLS